MITSRNRMFNLLPLLIGLAGCSGIDAQITDTEDSNPSAPGDLPALDARGAQDSALDPATDAPSQAPRIAATLPLAEDVTVEFIARGAEGVGVAVGGPLGSSEVARATQLLARAASPVEAFQSLAPADKAVPESLQALSRAAVSSGNWRAQARAASASNATVKALRPALSGIAEACRDLGFLGSLGEQYGTCVEYTRGPGQETYWWVDDVIAMGGHVIVTQGEVTWTVRHRNCNTGCNWTTDYTRVIGANSHYYFVMWDKNDDFRAESRVVTNGSQDSKHYHKVVRTHDYFSRVTPGDRSSTYDAILFDGIRLFSTCQDYEGPDPSNIATSLSWSPSSGVCRYF